MKSIFKISALICLTTFLFVCCQGDKSNSTISSGEADDTTIENNQNDISHEGHDHDGHDHDGHNHDGDSHSKPNSINNNAKPQDISSGKSTDQLEEGKGMVSSEEWAKKKQASTQGKQDPNPTHIGPKAGKTKLPSACNLINPKNIGKIVGVDSELISIKDGSGRANPHSQSCFFRWEHRGVPNSGIMVQVQDNPLPDEFPDWAKYYIQAKVHQGEQLPDGSGSYKYKPMDGIGDAGAYNYELNRYIWRIGSDYIFMVAFNLNATEAQELKWAKAIGNEVMKNF